MRLSSLLWIPLIFLFAAAAAAQVRIEGRVVSPDGAPVTDADVRLRGMDIEPLSTRTDSTGRYVFDGVKGTWLTIVVWRRGLPIAEAGGLATRAVETFNMTARREVATPTTTADLDPLEGPSGNITGTVRTADGTPVSAARISIGDTAVTTTTDQWGRYSFSRLRVALVVQVRAAAPGFQIAERSATVPAAGGATADFVLAAVAERSRGNLPGPNFGGTGNSESLDARDVTGLPAAARTDVLRGLQFLPSFQASNESTSELLTNGGARDQLATTFNGIPVYSFARLRGAFSGVQSGAIGTADFTSHPVDVTDTGVAGTLRLRGSSPERRPGGVVDVSAFGWATSVHMPFAGLGSLQFAARQSPSTTVYNDLLDAFTSNRSSSKPDRIPVFSGGALGLAPESEFRDLSGQLTLTPSTRDRILITAFNMRDQANRSYDTAVGGDTEIAIPDQARVPVDLVAEHNNAYNWIGRGSSGIWQREWSNTFATTVTFARSDFSSEIGSATILRDVISGADFSSFGIRDGSDALKESNNIESTTLRVEGRIRGGFRHGLLVGGEVVSLDATYDGLKESKSADASPTLSPFYTNDNNARLFTAFVQDAWRPTSRLGLTLGSRITRHSQTGDVYFEPRASATYTPYPNLELRGGWAVVYQPTQQIAREDRLEQDGAFWVVPDGDRVPLPWAQRATIGARFERSNVVLDASAYYLRSEDFSYFATPYQPNLPAPADSASLHIGSGRAAGINLLLQHRSSRNAFLASYGAHRSVRTFPSLDDGTFAVGAERPHEFKIVDTVRIVGPWSVGAAWVIASGTPETSVSVKNVWLGTSEVAPQLVFQAKNAARVPAYHRLDLTSEIALPLGLRTAAVGATLFNVYGRDNVWYRDRQVVGSSLVTNDVTFMGRAINIYARFTF